MDQISDHIRLLTDGQSHRVWSVIVTIFGDLAQAPGDEISGVVLAQITKQVGFKPEAVRVALHRLRKDGWIHSRRDGRTSVYALTDGGRQQSAWATPRIYGAAPAVPTCWHVLVSGGEGRRLEPFVVESGYLPIGSQAVLGPGPLPGDLDGLLGISSDMVVVPDWLRHQICPPDLVASTQVLFDRLTHLAAHPCDEATVLEVAALRVVVVHSWRRILLRHPDLPDQMFPRGWKGGACRDLVMTILDRLPKPSLAELDIAARG